ncbi:histone acetyltransferase p300-like isoform X3 [Acanthaster planci]|nr:histone acetyltransferase p300-like isoform X3 [Acanthaster planci]
MPAFEFVVPLTSNAGMGITMPIPGNTQPWQQFVTQDLRYHIVFKLVQAVFPSPDPKAMKDKGMGKVVAYTPKEWKRTCMSKPAVGRSTITSWLRTSTRSRKSCRRSHRRGCRRY